MTTYDLLFLKYVSVLALLFVKFNLIDLVEFIRNAKSINRLKLIVSKMRLPIGYSNSEGYFPNSLLSKHKYTVITLFYEGIN